MKNLVNAFVFENGESGFGISLTFSSGEKKDYDSLYTDRGDAERFCRMVNRGGVSECHIYDIIEDALP